MGKTTDAARGSVSSAVFESLKSAILGGAWPPGSKIPSENMLAKQFGISRVTMRAGGEIIQGMRQASKQMEEAKSTVK